MKMFFASLLAGVIWYGLLACFAATLFVCVFVLAALMLIASIMAGGPVLFCLVRHSAFSSEREYARTPTAEIHDSCYGLIVSPGIQSSAPALLSFVLGK